MFVPALLVLLNGTFASLSNILGGVAGRSLPSAVVVWVGAPGALVVVLIAAGSEFVAFSFSAFVVGIVAGIAASASLMAVYRAFSIGPVGLVAAIVACSGAVFISLAGFATGEAVTVGRVLGLVLCVVAVGMLTYRRDRARATASALRGPLLALAAAAGFTIYLLILDNAPPDSGMWSLVGARVGILVGASGAVALWWWRRRRSERVLAAALPASVGLAVAAGLLDGIGNVALFLALRVGELFLFAILAPYSPLFTAVIGRLFLKQRITRIQLAGVLLGAAALVIASLEFS